MFTTQVACIYCSILFKWEFFIQMRASCLPLSFHQKRGATERGWVQNRPFSFKWKTLIWIGCHCIVLHVRILLCYSFLAAYLTQQANILWPIFCISFNSDKTLKKTFSIKLFFQLAVDNFFYTPRHCFYINDIVLLTFQPKKILIRNGYNTSLLYTYIVLHARILLCYLFLAVYLTHQAKILWPIFLVSKQSLGWVRCWVC